MTPDLRPILAAPDGDAPRLDFADRLAAAGDAERADFIRVQCRLASLPAGSPKRGDLLRRERELLDAHAYAWAEPLGPRVTAWAFRRGFVEYVETWPEQSADEWRGLFAASPIRHVCGHGQVNDLAGLLDALPDAPPLTGLELWGLYACDDVQIARLLSSPHLANLRALILHHDRNGNTVDDAVLIDAFASPLRANLRELAVNVDGSWRGPSNEVIRAMCDSPHLRNIRALHLSNAGDRGNEPRMDADTVRAMGASPNFANLRWLDLGGANLSPDDWEELLRLPWLSRLKGLRLSGSYRLGVPDSFLSYARVADLPALRREFDDRVKFIDWQTPWVYESCTARGYGRRFSRRDERQRQLWDMASYLHADDPDGLEAAYRRRCATDAGESVAAAIDALPFAAYEAGLLAALREIVARPETNEAKCVVFRLRASINFMGGIQLRDADPHVHKPTVGGDDFVTPLGEVPTPPFPEAFRAYRGKGARYVLARTAAALLRCLRSVRPDVPVYFNCGDAIFRAGDG